jgi:phosphoribosylformylglycinamidine synthase II
VRLEVFYRDGFPDGRAQRLLSALRRGLTAQVTDLGMVDVYLIEGIPGISEELLREIFSDSVAQDIIIDRAAVETGFHADWDRLVEITARPGVTDPVALTARDALRMSLEGGLPEDAVVQTGVQYLVSMKGPASAQRSAGGPALDDDLLARFFHNPLIQTATCIGRVDWDNGRRPLRSYPHTVAESPASVERIDLDSLGDGELEALSRKRLLALSLAEMKAVRGYFRAPDVCAERELRGLSASATDVELEMIAQTWSEHCKHKIFNATIRYTEEGGPKNGGQTISSLFDTYIKKTTEQIGRSRTDLRSVFHDNSGVVAFDEDTLLCFKVETHNSPSALDPYGGAITGIVGVNRDILGTGLGAKPIFNTDVLCFGLPDTPESEVPEGLLHPRRVLEGVHRGIVDGGNQSGIPTVAGAFLFDESFLGKPLVFCGTGGILPASVGGRPSWEKKIEPGDLAVMAGGRIGKDGIHGATFSSEALSETSPTSAVQIGDPITQKKMLDFLLEARDLGLYRGLTDNGAGGLSSSLGEMASLSGGVRIELDRCPLKYKGLAPWEILVSESQERMSFAVPPESLDAFLSLAGKREVEATVVGEFTSSGLIEALFRGELVALVRLEFLHKGLPVMELNARWTAPAASADGIPSIPSLKETMLSILSDPNVASKEEWVRQYDHEVQARSVIKPFVGRDRDAPSDGAVLKVRPDSWRGITVTHGICPWYGDWDTFDMAQCAVDEALRAHVALGGDPDACSALDNFCWPDPVEGPDNPDGAFKLAQLVRACRGLAEACTAFGLPLISGKDSMKNDARIGGKRVSVRPTLLVSLMGIVPDVRASVTTDFKAPGDSLYVLGETRGELGCTRFQRAVRERAGKNAGRPLGRAPAADKSRPAGRAPAVHPARAMESYRRLHRAIQGGLVRSCHDLSDGGLWVAIAESALGGGFGARVELDLLPVSADCGREPERFAFSETPSRFLVSVAPRDEPAWRSLMQGLSSARVGEVTSGSKVRLMARGRDVAEAALDEIRRAWKSGDSDSGGGGRRDAGPGDPA